MANAAFDLKQCTGTNAATETTLSTRVAAFKNVDSVSVDTAAYPVPVPKDAGSSPAYSKELWLRLVNTAAPDNYCQNFKWWGPATRPDYEASPPNKVTIMAGTTGTGATPTSSASSVATTSQHNNYYSEGTGLTIGVVPGDSKIDAVGEKTNYLVLQEKVELGAAQGDLPTQVYYWGWEEV